ncbi:Modulator of FtsH protease HflK [Methyloligella halotolerans]|uniref:Protein HflK n=1 Tax=Methyloligella halotolerans TaxID=1177755 RepID=A0A1E2S3S9_9HYPH|nr:FtsH protease activity modulator HflK [Methyloligella halotolerans]ODA68985.1 Modulator of FtsH protease HflK [Methyloligella halotolerans]
MPWSNQSGGGGWKGGGGPWGQPPSGGGGDGGGRSGGGGGQQPDLEEILRRSQDRLRQAFPGGGGGGFGIVIGAIVGLFIVGYIVFALFTVRVETNEVGVVLRFGEYVRQLPPGLHFRMPYPVEQVLLPKFTRKNRLEIGGVGSTPTRPQESLMLTGDENIVDIDFVVIWKISDAPNYLFNVQNPEGTVRDVAESAMREVVGRSNIERILTQDRTETEQSVQKLMQRTLDRYKAGVEILQVQLQKADPPAQVIDAFRDVQAAKADQERLQNEAQSYANKVIPEARGEAERILQQAQGYRDRVIAEAQGEADRFSKIYDAYKTAPDVTRKRIFIETMQEVLAGRDKVILDDKGGQGVVPYLPLSEIKKPSTGSTMSGGDQ